VTYGSNVSRGGASKSQPRGRRRSRQRSVAHTELKESPAAGGVEPFGRRSVKIPVQVALGTPWSRRIPPHSARGAGSRFLKIQTDGVHRMARGAVVEPVDGIWFLRTRSLPWRICSASSRRTRSWRRACHWAGGFFRAPMELRHQSIVKGDAWSQRHLSTDHDSCAIHTLVTGPSDEKVGVVRHPVDIVPPMGCSPEGCRGPGRLGCRPDLLRGTSCTSRSAAGPRTRLLGQV